MSRKLKKVVVSYQKHFDNNGTCYNQVIKLDKSFMKYINKLVRYYFESSYEIQNIIAESVGFSMYYDCYLEELDTKEKYNYLTLTQLSFIYYYLFVNNYDVSRIKRRNTLLITA